MNIKPLHNNVVIRPASPEEITSSGLVIPQTASDEKPMQGEVVAVGPGKRMDDGTIAEMSVKQGEIVLFTKYAPDEVEIDGEEYLVVSEDKILATITK